MPLAPATTEASSCSGPATVTTSAPCAVNAPAITGASGASPTSSQVPESEAAALFPPACSQAIR